MASCRGRHLPTSHWEAYDVVAMCNRRDLTKEALADSNDPLQGLLTTTTGH